MPSETYRQCPYCAETIRAGARKCRFCHEWLYEEDEVTEQASDEDASPGHWLDERGNIHQGQPPEGYVRIGDTWFLNLPEYDEVEESANPVPEPVPRWEWSTPRVAIGLLGGAIGVGIMSYPTRPLPNGSSSVKLLLNGEIWSWALLENPAAALIASWILFQLAKRFAPDVLAVDHPASYQVAFSALAVAATPGLLVPTNYEVGRGGDIFLLIPMEDYVTWLLLIGIVAVGVFTVGGMLFGAIMSRVGDPARNTHQ